MPGAGEGVNRGWPVELGHGPVGLRPLRRSDARGWADLREANLEWLRRWDATAPDPDAAAPPTFRQMVRAMQSRARVGESFPWALTYEGRLVGQVSVAGIVRGAAQSGHVGYWIDQAVAGRGVVPTAVALAVDHAFGPARLHRIEVNVRPENTPSLRVVEKLGFRPEGLRRRLLHIDGQWRDHLSFALTAEEVAPDGMLARWLRRSGAGPR